MFGYKMEFSSYVFKIGFHKSSHIRMRNIYIRTYLKASTKITNHNIEIDLVIQW